MPTFTGRSTIQHASFESEFRTFIHRIQRQIEPFAAEFAEAEINISLATKDADKTNDQEWQAKLRDIRQKYYRSVFKKLKGKQLTPWQKKRLALLTRLLVGTKPSRHA